MKREFISNSEEETLKLAEDLGRSARRGEIFALFGELGTGKTIIAKGIARGLGVREVITSPTFNLLDIYQNEILLYHFDLFRIEKEDEFDQLSFEEYWEGDGVSVIEWADRALLRLPTSAIRVTIEYIDDNRRRITIEYPDN
jgi:tRNA threonylcarbamoyladenosine biosynthesis protein TsaE